MNIVDGIIEKALASTGESEAIDYKQSFDPAITPDWIEIIKDIVAIANSGGGTILIGINDDGSPFDCDIDCVLAIDPANVTNKIYKYTDYQFHDFQIKELSRNTHRVCAIIIGGVNSPLIFTEVGTYQIENGKQKAAFSKGTVYFRHGWGAGSDRDNILII